MKKNNLSIGIRSVLFSNLINLLFSLLTNFLLPKYLSVESYASIKTYQLYITYCGVLHLGFVDGMYIKFGGKTLEEIDKEKLKRNIVTLRVFQLVVTILFLTLSLVVRDLVFVAVSLSILPLNMISYFKSLYQAAGEFKRYGKILNINTISTFIINILLLSFLKEKVYIYFLILYVILNFVIWFILEYYFIRINNGKNIKFVYSFKELVENIKLGFFLMCGNFSSIILTTIDRWFVKITMNAVAFAQYSFAISLENFLNAAVTPISVTLYNYFCKNNNIDRIKNIRNYVIMFSVTIIASAFPAKFILENYLQNYLDSSKIIFILFAAQIFNINIKSIYVNLYKARKLQKKYFVKLVFIIGISLVFNISFWALFKKKEVFAIGTLLSSFIWYLLSLYDFKELKKQKMRVILYPLLCLFAFLITGFSLSSIVGLIVYILIVSILTFVIFNREFNNIIHIIKKKLSLIVNFK